MSGGAPSSFSTIISSLRTAAGSVARPNRHYSADKQKILRETFTLNVINSKRL